MFTSREILSLRAITSRTAVARRQKAFEPSKCGSDCIEFPCHLKSNHRQFRVPRTCAMISRHDRRTEAIGTRAMNNFDLIDGPRNEKTNISGLIRVATASPLRVVKIDLSFTPLRPDQPSVMLTIFLPSSNHKSLALVKPTKCCFSWNSDRTLLRTRFDHKSHVVKMPINRPATDSIAARYQMRKYLCRFLLYLF